MVQLRRRFLTLALLLALSLLPSSLSAITVTRVTCATTATLAYTATGGGTDTLLVRNAGTASVFLGPAAVTTANGFELIPGAGVSLPFNGPDTVYCIVAAATQRIDTVVGNK